MSDFNQSYPPVDVTPSQEPPSPNKGLFVWLGIFVLVLAVSGVAIASNTGDDEYQPTYGEPTDASDFSEPETEATVDAPKPRFSFKERTYVKVLKAEMPGDYSYVPARRIVKNGNMTCAAFDAGNTFEDVLQVYMQAYPLNTPEDAGFFIGTTTGLLCPEHSVG